MSNYQGEIKLTNLYIESLRGGEILDVLEKKVLEEIAIYEDLFEPSLSGKLIIRDEDDSGNKVPIIGEEMIIMDVEIPDSGEILLPPLYVYSTEEIKGKDKDGVGTRWWELRFATFGYNAAKWNTTHLHEDFEGPIHEFVQKLYDGAKDDFEMMIGQGEEYELELEETTNKVVYKHQYVNYPGLRKEGPRNVFTLINQCAENAISKENQNAVNFLFFQDLYGWKFKSIEGLVKKDPVKLYCETVQLDGNDEGPCGLKDAQIINNPKILDMGNRLQLARDGMFASVLKYYPPLVDVEKYPYWMVSSIETFYYKVNCRFLDRFPAAIVGFKRTDDVHRWHYAFAEVYLEYDYETHTPKFRIKPLSENPIRSNIKFTEEGIEEQEDAFYEPAHNTMEIGNDGFYCNEGPCDDDMPPRSGWEAPGVRIDTKMWEESCFKIQPIRGSHPMRGESGNNTGTDDDWDWVEDNVYPMGYWPIIEMTIYKDMENSPHYFFTAENAADGECSEADAIGDCPQVPEA